MKRKQIAAANWKMNLTFQEAEKLLNDILVQKHELNDNRYVVFAVPAPYLHMAHGKISGQKHMHIAAQNVYTKKSGAFTGEISVTMLDSLGIHFVVVGHSERREYFSESNQMLAEKVKLCLDQDMTPIFCCGEPLEVREANEQNTYVANQLKESLYDLDENQMRQVVIAYEPIWAIGTGKTATSEQAQEMHAFIRKEIVGKYGNETGDSISILYGGSVKASNAREIFSQPDVDGGLVGGASLQADEFGQIILALDQS